EAQFALTALLNREQVDAHRVIKEQIGGMLAEDVCRLFREQGIGNDEGMGEIWHCCVLSRVTVGLGSAHPGSRAQRGGRSINSLRRRARSSLSAEAARVPA